MTQLNTGTVAVTNGSAVVRGVFDYYTTSAHGPFLTGDSLTGATSGFTGNVVSWDSSTLRLKFYATSTTQPATGEKVTSTGTLSGTLTTENYVPTFTSSISTVGGVVPVFAVTNTTQSPPYYIGAVNNPSKFTLTANYAGSTDSDATYIVDNDFSIFNSLPLPNRGDQAPTIAINRSLVLLDNLLSPNQTSALRVTTLSGVTVTGTTGSFAGTLSAQTGSFSKSLTISGVPVNTAAFPAITGNTKTISLEYPSSTDNLCIFFTPDALTIASARAVVSGTSSSPVAGVTMSIKSGTDRSSLGTTHTTSTNVGNTTTGTSLSISNSSIAANSYVCVVTTATSGTPVELDVALKAS